VKRSEARSASLRAGPRVITQGLEPDRDGNTDRGSVVRKITELVQWVAMLDAIGWQEPSDAPNEFVVTVDSALATWARGAAAELERAFGEFYVTDEDLGALAGLRLIAAAVRSLAPAPGSHRSRIRTAVQLVTGACTTRLAKPNGAATPRGCRDRPDHARSRPREIEGSALDAVAGVQRDHSVVLPSPHGRRCARTRTATDALSLSDVRRGLRSALAHLNLAAPFGGRQG
jgi:hypothetical protein